MDLDVDGLALAGDTAASQSAWEGNGWLQGREREIFPAYHFASFDCEPCEGIVS